MRASLAFVRNMLVVYVVYAICRLAFLLENWTTLGGGISFGSLGEMLHGALIFDTSAIFYTNALYALMMLLPLHVKDNGSKFSRWWHAVAKWIFVVVNGICVSVNLADAVYFQFTGRRTTMSVFEEFGNEGNIGGIVGIELLRHWYIVLLGVTLIYGLVRLYAKPRSEKMKPWRWKGVRYYTIQMVALQLFVPVCIAGMRGGFSTAVRPITISNANQYVDTPAEAAMILNTPFSLIRTMSKKSFVDPGYYTREELSTIYSPVHDGTHSDSDAKNVVVLIVESFCKQYIGSLNGLDHGYTPEIDKIVAKSLTFDYSYCNGRKSIDGMPSVLSGIPMFIEPFFLTPSSMNDVSGIAGELSKKGYYTAFFHGAENGSMGFQAFARATGFKDYFGRTEYNSDKRFGGDSDFDGTWAIWDEPFLQFYVKKMSEMKQPFMTAVFTASSHHPFAVPEQYKDVYKEEGDNPLRKCIRYTDMALGKFFAEASRQPWYQNTIFVLTSDHTNGVEDKSYATDLGLYSVPIVIFDPSGRIKPERSQSIAQQTDIMPTILGALGYDNPYVAFGKDLLRTPAEDTWAVNYMNGIYQFVKGHYLLQFDGNELKAVYDFRKDAQLKNNLLQTKKNDAEVKAYERQLKAIIQSYMQRMIENELVIHNP